jgi:hypothetical protein
LREKGAKGEKKTQFVVRLKFLGSRGRRKRGVGGGNDFFYTEIMTHKML